MGLRAPVVACDAVGIKAQDPPIIVPTLHRPIGENYNPGWGALVLKNGKGWSKLKNVFCSSMVTPRTGFCLVFALDRKSVV